MAIALSAVLLPSAVCAQEGFEYGSFIVFAERPELIVLDGVIGPGADADFAAALADFPAIQAVALNSAGGFAPAAIAIAEVVHTRNLSTIVPEGSACVSACAIIFFAGASRLAVGGLGVHRGASPVTMTAAEQATYDAALADELLRLGMPATAVALMAATPFEATHMFTGAEMEAFGVNRLDPGLSRLLPLPAYPLSTVASLQRDDGLAFSAQARWSEADFGGGPAITVSVGFLLAGIELMLVIERAAGEGGSSYYALGQYRLTATGVGPSPGVIVRTPDIGAVTDVAGGGPRLMAGVSTALAANGFEIALAATDLGFLAEAGSLFLRVEFADGHSGVIVIETGEAGRRVIAAALAAWDAAPPADVGALGVEADLQRGPPGGRVSIDRGVAYWSLSRGDAGAGLLVTEFLPATGLQVDLRFGPSPSGELAISIVLDPRGTFIDTTVVDLRAVFAVTRDGMSPIAPIGGAMAGPTMRYAAGNFRAAMDGSTTAAVLPRAIAIEVWLRLATGDLGVFRIPVDARAATLIGAALRSWGL